MADVQQKIQAAAAEYSTLLSTLAESDYAIPALEQQTLYVRSLNDEMSKTQKLIKDLEQKTKKERAEHEKYAESTVKRFAYKLGGKKGTAKFQDKAAKEEKEFFEAWQQEKQAKDRRDTLSHKLDEANQEKAKFESAATVNREAQESLNNMYERIFAGPTPQYPEEDAKEEAVNQARSAFDNIAQQCDASNRSVQLLSQAMLQMKRALGMIASAEQSSQMDMIGFGSTFMDIAERQDLAQAQSHVLQANMLMNQARSSDQTAEIQPMPRMEIAQGNIMSDMIFDNIFTDYMFHQKIQQSAVDVQRGAVHLQRQLELQNRRLQQRQQEMNEAKQILEEARQELKTIRQLTFERVANPPPEYAPPAYEETQS